MSSTSTVVSAFILMLLAVGSPAKGASGDLELGKARNGTLGPGQADAYGVPLKPEEVATTNVVTHGTKLVITVFGPSGEKIRGFQFDGSGRDVSFLAKTEGRYRLQVALDRGAESGPYTITLTRVLALSTLNNPLPGQYQSPRIKVLQAALQSDPKTALEAFWKEVQNKGAPLVEPLDGDSDNMLVTFLWKGTLDTKGVMVCWWPFASVSPDDYRLTRLGRTDVWFRSVKVEKHKRFMYQMALNPPSLAAPLRPETFAVIDALSQADPLNPKRWLVEPGDPDLPEYQGASFVEMPDAPAQPWLAKREGVPSGTIERHQVESASLKGTREVVVYVPPAFSKDSNPYDLLIVFDERQYLNDDKNGTIIPTPQILDNLISAKRIPPTVALLIDTSQARLSDLGCNAKFSDFLSLELLPWAQRSYNVTSDPRRTVVAGASAGGLAAACAGLYHPQNFGNILSQSGSFWWAPARSGNPDDLDDPMVEPNWIARQFLATPKLPLRFYMEAGSDEDNLLLRGSGLLPSNRHFRDVLLARGYEVHYHEFSGGHDFLSWRGDLADGLITLLGSEAQ
jgi:enterochelin esterase-like enzyme